MFHLVIKHKDEIGSLSVAQDRIVVLNEADHVYRDLETGKEYLSTTKAIKGTMSEEKKIKVKLNLDLGNDFDKIAEGIAAGLEYKEIVKKMIVLKDTELSEKAYNQMLDVISEAKKGGAVVIPQVIFSDEKSLMAGTADLVLIQLDGKIGIIDLKTSKNSIRATDNFYDFPHKLEEDSLLKTKGGRGTFNKTTTWNPG